MYFPVFLLNTLHSLLFFEFSTHWYTPLCLVGCTVSVKLLLTWLHDKSGTQFLCCIYNLQTLELHLALPDTELLCTWTSGRIPLSHQIHRCKKVHPNLGQKKQELSNFHHQFYQDTHWYYMNNLHSLYLHSNIFNSLGYTSHDILIKCFLLHFIHNF